jgi:hypothetical protein
VGVWCWPERVETNQSLQFLTQHLPSCVDLLLVYFAEASSSVCCPLALSCLRMVAVDGLEPAQVAWTVIVGAAGREAVALVSGELIVAF